MKKINRFLFRNKLNKPLKYLYSIGFYLSALYVIEYHFDLDLFLELGILYGVIKYLYKI